MSTVFKYCNMHLLNLETYLARMYLQTNILDPNDLGSKQFLGPKISWFQKCWSEEEEKTASLWITVSCSYGTPSIL